MKARQIQRFVWLILALTWLGPVQAAFTDNGDGTVTDTVTGLMWDQCSWGLSGTGCATGTASTQTWSAAQGVAVTANAQNSGAGYKNHNDWRLPNRTELVSLVNYATSDPAIDTAFPNTPASYFWSSTVYAPNLLYAWVVRFNNGFSTAYARVDAGHVRLVRSGQSFGAFDEIAGLSPATTTISVTGSQSYTYNGSGQGPSTANVTGSGGTVSYSYSGTGSTTYAASALPPTNAGTYQVIATVAADSNYQAATSAAYAFSIAKATLTITANPQTVAYGTAASTVTGNGSYTPSGFVNSETAAVISGSASYTTTYTATTAPGASVSITPVVSGLTATNYDFTPANGTVTVTADATTISVTGSQSYTYTGSAQGPSTATVTGSTGAVTYSYSGTGSTTYAASALRPTNAGTYQVIATVAADSNYQAATSAAYAFSIDPATQPDFTVTISQNALEVNESATLSATGALGNGGVSFSVAAGDPCSVVNSTLTAVATGLCTVTATSAADVNYQVATDTLIVNVNLNPQTSLVLAASTNPIGVNGTSTLSTTGGSGSGTVSYAVDNSDPCTLSGNILTATGAGTCTVTATKAADSVYAAATSSPVSVTELPVEGGGTTPGGQVTADITGGSCAGYDPGSPRFTVPSNPPANSNFPYGVFSFTALACGPGGNVTITLTYPQPLPPGTRYLKYLNDTWVDWTQRVTISGNTVTLTITDGGEGDTNPTAGEISDPIGPSIGNNPPPANPIPTLSEWAQSMMIFLLIVTAGFYGWRMKPR